MNWNLRCLKQNLHTIDAYLEIFKDYKNNYLYKIICSYMLIGSIYVYWPMLACECAVHIICIVI